MKQSDISQQLGSLIGTQQSLYGNPTPADEEIPAELTEPDPIFTIDYNQEKIKSNSDATEFVKILMMSIVPAEHQNNSMITNKMKVDSVQLGMLYYQQKLNEVVLQTSIDAIAKGDLSPRLFEVVDKLQKRASDLSNQITELQNQFRKYYIDAYLDIESKMAADEQDNENLHLAAPEKEQKKLDTAGVKELEDGAVRITSTKQMNEVLQQKRIEAMKKQKAEETIEEASVDEEIDF